MDKKMLELAVLPMVLHATPKMSTYEVSGRGYQRPGCTTTKAIRRKKRAQRKARKQNRK